MTPPPALTDVMDLSVVIGAAVVGALVGLLAVRVLNSLLKIVVPLLGAVAFAALAYIYLL